MRMLQFLSESWLLEGEEEIYPDTAINAMMAMRDSDDSRRCA